MPPDPFEWYYIGRFGQLGPLSLDQMQDLVRDSVIDRETYIWKIGMEDWIRAGTRSEFFVAGPVDPPSFKPPTAPTPDPVKPQITYSESNFMQPPGPPVFDQSFDLSPGVVTHRPQLATVPYSTRSRIAAGVLNLLLPGIGRIYAGSVGTGLMQLLTSLCFGIGYVWSLVDGILYLVGNNKVDGQGRPFRD